MRVFKGAVVGGIGVMLLAGCSPRVIDLGGDETGTSSSSSTSSASSGETTEDPSTSTSGMSTTHDFVPETDESEPDCEIFEQDCPEGEKCVPYASSGGNWDANKCVPIMGTQASGDPCWYGGAVEATDDCDGTSMCWDFEEVDGMFVGSCRLFCTGTPDDPSCPVGSQCLIGSDSTIALCIPRCDPLEQDCGASLGCYWANDGFQCIFTAEGALPTNDPCGYINDCPPGGICIDSAYLPECMGSACCSSFCDLNLGPGQCDAVPGTVCVPFFEFPAPGDEHIGVCILP